MSSGLKDNGLNISIFAFITGGITLAFELASAKLIAPFYGSSLKVWASVLGWTLLGLALGYYCGGMLSKKQNAIKIPSFMSSISGILIFSLPFISPKILEWSYRLNNDTGVVLSSFLIIMPVMAIIGTITPVLIKLATKDVGDAGNIAGRIYAISTVGSVAMTFMTGFYLIPYLGVSKTFYASGIVMATAAFYFAASFKLKTFKLHLAVAAFLAVILTVTAIAEAKLPPMVRYKNSGLYGELMVIDFPYYWKRHFNRRLLLNDRIGQTNIDLDTGASLWDYTHYIASMASVKPKGGKALLFGLAGGSIANELLSLGYSVDAVDIDDRVFDVARRFFFLSDGVNFINSDARHFVNLSKNKYDVVIFDLYSAENQPYHMFTYEAFVKLKAMLNPGAMVFIQFDGSLDGKIGRGLRSVYNTLRFAGYNVRYTPTSDNESSRNIIIIAYTGNALMNFGNLQKQNKCCIDITAKFPIKVHEIDEDKLRDALILRDDLPVFEILNQSAFHSWRKYAINVYSLHLKIIGVPYF